MSAPVSLSDYRRLAKRRLPRFIFDFVDGGAGNEITLRENEEALGRLRFAPRAQTDVSRRSTATTVLGEQLALPVMLAPTGLQRLVHPGADPAAARAATSVGSNYVVSSASAFSVEDVARAAERPLWFQLYLWRDRAAVEHVVERARNAGCSTLVVTVDVPLVGRRERDLRNGMTLPPRLTPRNVYEGARHPRWAWHLLTGPEITFKNFEGLVPDAGGMALMSYANTELVNPAAGWDDLARLRDLWSGKLVVKGVMTGPDASQAVAHGADGIVVSNHGGRQLDGLPATIDVLPEVVDAVGSRAEVMLDGGVRRGTDVLAAVALGAKAVFIGRPYLWALACQGERGVAEVLRMLREELDAAMALTGRPTIDTIGPDLLWRGTQGRTDVDDVPTSDARDA